MEKGAGIAFETSLTLPLYPRYKIKCAKPVFVTVQGVVFYTTIPLGEKKKENPSKAPDSWGVCISPADYWLRLNKHRQLSDSKMSNQGDLSVQHIHSYR